jgi:hypothetical protein
VSETTIGSTSRGVRWAIAVPACVLAPILGAWAGYAGVTILTFGIFGTDVDGAFNLFLFAPIGISLGFGIGLFFGSKLINWARDPESSP